MSGLLTRNYYNIITARFGAAKQATDSTVKPTTYDPPLMVRTASGNYLSATITTSPFDECSYLMTRNLAMYGGKPADNTYSYVSLGDIGICFGTGTTPADYEDFNISGNYAPLTLQSGTGTYTAPILDSTGKNIISGRDIIATNGTANTLTVGEVGLFAPLNNPRAGYAWINSALIYRDVFGPITVEPGESLLIHFVFNCPIMNYTPYPSD